ncbi:MAG: PAS domain S-box protein [Candidatus Heimdallarchaeota archaeon]|nr:PAS domain S-box protein [Candidatus Heimdallarchaeota archaeon]
MQRKDQTAESLKYKLFFDSSTEGILIHKPGGQIYDLNPAIETMFGYSKEELQHMTIWDLHPPETVNSGETARDEFLEGKQVEFELLMQKKNKERFYVNILANQIELNGQMYILALVRDITERKLAQKTISELEDLLPICAKCKKIRDDQGYWDTVEMYMQAHSNLKFTHSLCPECISTLFPGYKNEETTTKKQET